MITKGCCGPPFASCRQTSCHTSCETAANGRAHFAIVAMIVVAARASRWCTDGVWRGGDRCRGQFRSQNFLRPTSGRVQRTSRRSSQSISNRRSSPRGKSSRSSTTSEKRGRWPLDVVGPWLWPNQNQLNARVCVFCFSRSRQTVVDNVVYLLLLFKRVFYYNIEGWTSCSTTTTTDYPNHNRSSLYNTASYYVIN